MLFNWQIEDTCVVFRWWHIQGPISLILSCAAIFFIAAGYEWIRSYVGQVESKWTEAEILLSRSEDDEPVSEGQTMVHAYQQHNRYYL